MKNFRKLLFVGLAALVLLATLGLMNQPEKQSNTTFKLQMPLFADVARADTGAIASFMEDEAGISCYFQASSSITLDDVKDIFRTIEVETADYIIGSVPVGEYPESEDVHVYVHTDGWMVAYYLAADPAAKIFDWRHYHDNGLTTITTKLENTLAVLAGEAGVSFTEGIYYDFRYPNATHLMLIAEWVSNGTDSFEVNLPGSFAYSERSWSLGSIDDGSYTLDEVKIFGWQDGSWRTTEDTLSASQMLPDQFHTIDIWGQNYTYGGLALIYKEQ